LSRSELSEKQGDEENIAYGHSAANYNAVRVTNGLKKTPRLGSGR